VWRVPFQESFHLLLQAPHTGSADSLFLEHQILVCPLLMPSCLASVPWFIQRRFINCILFNARQEDYYKRCIKKNVKAAPACFNTSSAQSTKWLALAGAGIILASRPNPASYPRRTGGLLPSCRDEYVDLYLHVPCGVRWGEARSTNRRDKRCVNGFGAKKWREET
jgi:hypothetical protein